MLNIHTATDFDDARIIKEIWKYNLATGVWTCLPEQRFFPTNNEIILGMTFKSEKLIVVTWNKCQSKGYLYTHYLKNENEVEKMTTKGPLPKRFFSHNFISHGSYLYTIGNDRGLGVFRIDPETGIWEKMSPDNGDDFPGDYADIELAFDGRKIYVIFVKLRGERIHLRINFGIDHVVDPETKETSIVISGGTMDRKIYSDVWQLRLSTLRWTCLNKLGSILPLAICEHDATTSRYGKMYVFGGRIKRTNNRLTEVNSLYSAWLRIPKLADICWEAVNYYYKDLNSKTDEELFELGLPIKFVRSRCQ
ncbi:Similar to slim: Kelch domain-containing protein 10 homolog (Drosophila melanogaster) [Cotesia congregata]|uniref:Similar to slim: Kelch domain-containing protein 10 homolog (Drosophila melanogaster) n=1 Tax=Cotesia congregata TaxID=51543 RepID=A0A8J2HFZ7_COTCN|nr:Similar to slim: Kelch domain-containing protein 10 homolog (Drosophila melanogaster) [Cotesia congregata]